MQIIASFFPCNKQCCIEYNYRLKEPEHFKSWDTAKLPSRKYHTSLHSCQVHGSVCFPITQLSASMECYSLFRLPVHWPAPSQPSFQIFSCIPSHLLFSLNTCSFRKQIPHNILWPKESVVWGLLSMTSGRHNTTGHSWVKALGRKELEPASGRSESRSSNSHISLILGAIGLVWLHFHLLSTAIGNISCRQPWAHSYRSRTLD